MKNEGVFGMIGERDDLRRFRDGRRSGTISLGITKRKMFEVVDRLVFSEWYFGTS